MANVQVTVPDIGGAEGAEVIELLVAVGDRIEVDQGLIVLESDKASMEIPSTVAGKVVELLVAEGQELSEGAAVAVVEVEGDGDAQEEAAASSTDSEPEVESGPEELASGPEPEGEPAPAEEKQPEPEAAPAAEPELVVVPDIGTEDAVDLIEVCVRVGDVIAEGDSLVVLESDKASMEVPAPFAGEVAEIRVEEGSSVRQGDPLLTLRTASAGKAPEAATSASSETRTDAGSGVSAAESGAAASASTPAEPTPASPPEPDTPETSASAGVYAGPAVRKLAREFGVPLAEVTGSGPRGRVLKEDLHEFVKQRLKSPATGAPSAGAPSAGAGIPLVPEVDYAQFGEVETKPRSKLDKLTAYNMQRSWLNVPHVTQYDDADITELEAFRNSLKTEAQNRGTRLTPMPFLLKACAVALRDNPKFRSSLADGGESLVTRNYIHIGMAVDTPAGLLVPVIRDVDKKGIWELAEEVLDLADKARDRKLTPKDMQGGCFTISSLGGIGGTGFTPIVNAPEVGILGVSRADTKPVWDGSSFVPRKMLPLSLSYDHRVVNGGDGGRFMSQLVSLLGDIRTIMM